MSRSSSTIEPAPKQTAPQGKLFYGWVIVGAGLVVWIIEPGLYTSFGVFFKPISEDLGWTRGAVSLALAVASLMLGAVSPFAGALSDRYGPRRLVMLSGLLIATGYSMLSTIHSLWQFYLFFIFVSSGMGIAFSPIMSTVARWFVEKRGQALGLTGIGTGIGGVLFPPLANYLIGQIGWRHTYLLLGLVLGALVLLAGTFLRRSPEEMGLRPYGAERVEARYAALGRGAIEVARSLTLRQTYRTFAFWAVFFAAFAAVFSFFMMQVHLVPHATDLGVSAATAAIVMSVLGASNSVGRLAGGAISDRVGRKKTMITTLLVTSLAMLSLTVTRSTWMFFVFALVFGLAYGGTFIAWQAIPGEFFGLASMGAILGSFQLGTNSGGAAGSYVAGTLFDLTGSYTIVFFIAAGILAVAAVLVALARPPTRSQT